MNKQTIEKEMISFARNSCIVKLDSLFDVVTLQCKNDSEIECTLQGHEAEAFIYQVKSVYNEGFLNYDDAAYLVAYDYLDLLQP